VVAAFPPNFALKWQYVTAKNNQGGTGEIQTKLLISTLKLTKQNKMH
jgi:hypothetical protein